MLNLVNYVGGLEAESFSNPADIVYVVHLVGGKKLTCRAILGAQFETAAVTLYQEDTQVASAYPTSNERAIALQDAADPALVYYVSVANILYIQERRNV